MSHPFNSPRQAINWLKRRGLIESTEGMTIYQHLRPARLMRWDGNGNTVNSDPKEQADSDAEKTLCAYGYVFKRPKVPRGMPNNAITGRILSAMYGSSDMVIRHDTSFDEDMNSVAVDTAAHEPVRGFVPGPVMVEEHEWQVPNIDEIMPPSAAPAALPSAAPINVGYLPPAIVQHNTRVREAAQAAEMERLSTDREHLD